MDACGLQRQRGGSGTLGGRARLGCFYGNYAKYADYQHRHAKHATHFIDESRDEFLDEHLCSS
eukprot:5830211-Lingulodinium_polyedra.AAC.1